VLIDAQKAVPLDPKQVEKKLDDIIERFNETTRTRNEFNHCMYVIDEHGEITHTNHMRVQEVKGRLQLGVVRPMDDARIRELQESIRAMTRLTGISGISWACCKSTSPHASVPRSARPCRRRIPDVPVIR
jgi:hypothetical protein